MNHTDKNRNPGELNPQDVDGAEEAKVDKEIAPDEELPEQDDKLIGDDLAIQQAKQGDVEKVREDENNKNNY